MNVGAGSFMRTRRCHPDRTLGAPMCYLMISPVRQRRPAQAMPPDLAPRKSLSRWIHARFSPEGWLGLHLTIGALMLVGAAWLFGALAEDVVNRDPIVVIDEGIANWFHARATPAAVEAMKTLTFFGSTAWIGGTAALLAIYLARRRDWYRLIVLLLITPGGAGLNLLIKMAFHRQRPFFADPIQALDSYSFPSGHTMAATLFYGLLAVFAFRYLPSVRGRLFAILCAVVLIALVGLSRIGLGVHYFSDVVAAVTAGLAWLTLCVTAVETLRRRLAELKTPIAERRPPNA